MQPLFTFNQDEAKKAGPSGASESGAYTGIIRTALFTTSRDANSKSESMEFSLDADVGPINFLRVSYVGRDGNPLQGGNAMIQAIMGLTGVKALHATEQVNSQNETEYHCKELEGKPIGFVLQKVLYTKNNGSDGYRFEIRQAFGTKTRKTYKEGIEGLPAETVDKLVETLSDKDERQQAGCGPAGGPAGNQQRSMLGGQQNQQQPQSNLHRAASGGRNQQQPPVQDFDDDIPF
ncbi:hypothetical protein [Erwinia sp. Leaf53]|uniref:hypothetical protein n=1 Tax=Erwinia sp. Leaf53 TaxID=1736225 RepID=UPI0006FEF93B|nr:hypothetical protein [Erwinia sp. Leaf53]KQN63659.1 hypothetical protein ASF13_18970 [Erwinia sp. Leaf53]